MSPSAGLEAAASLLTELHGAPSLTSDKGAVLIEETLEVIRNALEESYSVARQAEAARATARVAIGHLQAVLLNSRSHYDQQRADTAARDWLASIGAD